MTNDKEKSENICSNIKESLSLIIYNHLILNNLKKSANQKKRPLGN